MRALRHRPISAPGCHGEPGAESAEAPAGSLRVALVGAPNVGKSALFNRLTGRYVTVSNYPGTSIELARGSGLADGVALQVVDTPGMYSLLCTNEEERITRRLILEGGADVLVQVLDAKNLARMLPLTLQLLELDLPLVAAVNMVDEAERLGIRTDLAGLTHRLGIEVVPVVAVTGRGIGLLRSAIVRARERWRGRGVPPRYGNGVGAAIGSLGELLQARYSVDRGALAALLLQGDPDAVLMVSSREADQGRAALEAARGVASSLGAPAPYRLAVERQRAADALLAGLADAGKDPGTHRREWVSRLGRALARPVTGLPVLLLITYLGLYLFVGRLGAGVLVNWLEGTVFEGWINPFFERAFAEVPGAALRSLFVGDYGLLTLGLRYAVAIILPLVGTFFLFFSVLEDSGYFPRLALLVDRLFKRLGLSGRAVIPMVLGFACDTMATMVTRTLETRRERILATLLLALAIPCSAQLGVILALLAGHPEALAVWLLAVIGSLLLVGAIGSRVLPGPQASFHMELPPLRRPRLGNVVTKTYTRMQWYFFEVLPLFLAASVLLWIGNLTGLFGVIIHAIQPVVEALGLPRETAGMFLFGFFRRDYGAAGLFDLSRHGLLDPIQLTTAAVTLTLFMPCIAQFLMVVKERGWRPALAMVAFITPFAFGAGFLVNLIWRALR